jgi:hypothetical protein
MDKLFKNCNVIYFKKAEIFSKLIEKDNIFKGKIIISDFQELNRLCAINGLIHVLNINTHHVPNEKIDCIVTDNIKNSDLEANIVKNSSGIPILYTDLSKKQQYVWCGICNKIYTNEYNHPISRYCSEKCMNKENGFSSDLKPDTIVDVDRADIVSRLIRLEKQKEEQTIIPFDKSDKKKPPSNVKKTVDKFQSSMVKDAIRLEYAIKRESYKREMRQPSLRKANLSDKKERKLIVIDEVPVIKLCKGVTKKNKTCTNKCINNSLYCGILSHSMGGSAGELMEKIVNQVAIAEDTEE